VLLFASGAAAESSSSAESSAQLRARATRLYRAKRFAAACPVFEAALRASPGEPELLTDLALCQHRLGNDALARQTNLEAIARASEPAARLSEPRFARIRRHAYFNLAELEPGEPSDQPLLEREQQCWALPSAPACTKTMHACGVSRTGGGRNYRSDEADIRVAETAEAARFDENDGEVSPDWGELATPSAELPVAITGDGALDFVDRFSEEETTYQCEWSCEGSTAVADEVDKCRSNPKASASTREQCSETVCARAERAPWAAVRGEQADSDACYQYAATVDGEYGCFVVYANACTGLLGLLCSGHAGGERESRSRVEEYQFQGAPTP
jgi:hypothetical protein